MTAPKYAKDTEVPYQRSLEEIQFLLSKHQITKFGYIRDNDNFVSAFAFERQGRRFRFTIPLPDINASEFQYMARGVGGKQKRTPEQTLKAWEKVINQRYRAVSMIIKAKLIAIDEGIATFEDEFLDKTLIPGTDITVGEWATEQLTKGYLTGKVPPLLPPSL